MKMSNRWLQGRLWVKILCLVISLSILTPLYTLRAETNIRTPEQTKLFEDTTYGYSFSYPTHWRLNEQWHSGADYTVEFQDTQSPVKFYVVIENFYDHPAKLEAWLDEYERFFTGSLVLSNPLILGGVNGIQRVYGEDGLYWHAEYYVFQEKVYRLSIGGFADVSLASKALSTVRETFKWDTNQLTPPVDVLPPPVDTPSANRPSSVQGKPTLHFPFCGTWRITRDYAGHQAYCEGKSDPEEKARCLRYNGYALDWVVHSGETLKAPIYAAHSGTATTFTSEAGGKTVAIVYDGDNYYGTRYVHLNDFSVSTGTYVRAGQQIGRAGNTGAESLGPHLHFTFFENMSVRPNSIKPEPMSGKSGFKTRDSYTHDCSVPPDITFSAPDQNQWYNTDQTISWTITDVFPGVHYYKWAWNNPAPDQQVNSNSGSSIRFDRKPENQIIRKEV